MLVSEHPSGDTYILPCEQQVVSLRKSPAELIIAPVIVELQREYDRAIKTSNDYNAINQPDASVNVAQYADGIRFAIKQLERVIRK